MDMNIGLAIIKHAPEIYLLQVSIQLLLSQISTWLSCIAVTSKMMDETHSKGDAATFVCQATSEPISNIIHWNFNGIPIIKSDKYQISTNQFNYTTITNTLTVMSVESSDVGTYTCSVSNGRSADTSSAVLSVNGM